MAADGGGWGDGGGGVWSGFENPLDVDESETVDSLNKEKAVTSLLKSAEEVKQLTVGQGLVGLERVLACKITKNPLWHSVPI